MSVVDKLPTFESKALLTLQQNAKRLAQTGTETQKAEAEVLLLAIEIEQGNRDTAAESDKTVRQERIRRLVEQKSLFERVLFAFTEAPPKAWEAEVLNEISTYPGRDFDTIAHAVGKGDGGYVNLVVGGLCSAREAYLGIAPPSSKRRGEKLFSELLIDFTCHTEPDGVEWHGWTLKPDADAALKQLRIVGGQPEAA